MNITRRIILKGSAATVATALTGASLHANAQSSKGVFNFKASTNLEVNHPGYIRLAEACEKIKQETAGKVNIRVFPNSQLGSDTDVLSQLRSGAVEVQLLAGVILANLVPMSSLNSVGFAFGDYPSVWKAMDGKLGGYIRAHIVKSNLHVFEKVWDNGFRQVTSQKPITKPADLAGIKIRVPVSPILLSLFEALRSSPAPINRNDLYSALQTKIVDAQENPLAVIDASKYYEVQKHCALTRHVWDGHWLLANRRAFSALPSNLQDIVARNFNAAGLLQRKDCERLDQNLERELAAKGMQFTKPNMDEFRTALKQSSYYSDWRKKFGDEAWGHLEAAVGKLAA
jgi:tripartite ATP-independent transporter DctP family solute receptor